MCRAYEERQGRGRPIVGRFQFVASTPIINGDNATFGVKDTDVRKE